MLNWDLPCSYKTEESVFRIQKVPMARSSISRSHNTQKISNNSQLKPCTLITITKLWILLFALNSKIQPCKLWRRNTLNELIDWINCMLSRQKLPPFIWMNNLMIHIRFCWARTNSKIPWRKKEYWYYCFAQNAQCGH